MKYVYILVSLDSSTFTSASPTTCAPGLTKHNAGEVPVKVRTLATQDIMSPSVTESAGVCIREIPEVRLWPARSPRSDL